MQNLDDTLQISLMELSQDIKIFRQNLNNDIDFNKNTIKNLNERIELIQMQIFDIPSDYQLDMYLNRLFKLKNKIDEMDFRISFITQDGIYSSIINKIQQAITTNDFIPIQFNSKWYQLEFDKNKNQLACLRFKKNIFASGSLANLRIVRNILDNKTEVFKQAKETAKNSRSTIANEFLLLNEIQKNSKVWGIQEAPRKLTEMTEGADSRFGYLTLQYDQNYDTAIMQGPQIPNFIDSLEDIHQVLSGLKELHHRDILHGDIKPANVLVKKTVDNARIVHLADLGSAVKCGTENSCDEIKGKNRGASPAFFPAQDFMAGEKVNDPNEIKQIEKKRDVFALGSILYCALQKVNYPRYDTYEQQRPLVTDSLIINNPTVPPEIRELVKNMMHPSHAQRPSAAEAFKIFDQYLKSSHPMVHERIWNKIQKEYPGTLKE